MKIKPALRHYRKIRKLPKGTSNGEYIKVLSFPLHDIYAVPLQRNYKGQIIKWRIRLQYLKYPKGYIGACLPEPWSKLDDSSNPRQSVECEVLAPTLAWLTKQLMAAFYTKGKV